MNTIKTFLMTGSMLVVFSLIGSSVSHAIPRTIGIQTCKELQDIDKNPNFSYQLEKDINCNNFQFKPIPFFGGTLSGIDKNGEKHTISNLTIATNGPASIFGTLAGATIEDLTFSNLHVKSFSSDVSALAMNVTGQLVTPNNFLSIAIPNVPAGTTPSQLIFDYLRGSSRSGLTPNLLLGIVTIDAFANNLGFVADDGSSVYKKLVNDGYLSEFVKKGNPFSAQQSYLSFSITDKNFVSEINAIATSYKHQQYVQVITDILTKASANLSLAINGQQLQGYWTAGKAVGQTSVASTLSYPNTDPRIKTAAKAITARLKSITEGSIIKNLKIDGTLTSAQGRIHGLILNLWDQSYVSNAFLNFTTNGSWNTISVNGLVENNLNGTISKSHINLNDQTGNDNVVPVAGINYGNINNTYATGWSAHAGCFIYSNQGKVLTSYSNLNTEVLSGISGLSQASPDLNFGTIQYSYWNSDMCTGDHYLSQVNKSSEVSSKFFANKSNFKTWDFNKIWTIKDGYPAIKDELIQPAVKVKPENAREE